MGKIRVRTLGDEKQEKQEKKKAQLKSEARKTKQDADLYPVKKVQEEKKQPDEIVEQKTSKPENAEKTKTIKEPEIEAKKSEKAPKTTTAGKKSKFAKKQKRSDSYTKVAKIVDKNKKYSLKEALEILPKLKIAKFDETVELHINTIDKGISGSYTLPHGTGKQIRIEILSQTNNPKHVEEVIKKIETGSIDFDVLIATPDTMPRLARVARVLGPRGLMPNPKNGTISPKPDEVAKKFQGGQINFKTESKFPILHLSVGKISFGDKKLEDNIKTAISSVQTKNIKNITLKSTMSPGIKIDSTSI